MRRPDLDRSAAHLVKDNNGTYAAYAIDPHLAYADQRVNSTLVAYCLIHDDGSCCGDVAFPYFGGLLGHLDQHHHLGAVTI